MRKQLAFSAYLRCPDSFLQRLVMRVNGRPMAVSHVGLGAGGTVAEGRVFLGIGENSLSRGY